MPSTSPPASPPRLNRALTDHPSSRVTTTSSSSTTHSTSFQPHLIAAEPLDGILSSSDFASTSFKHRPDGLSDVTVSSASPRGATLTRARTRSVSSHAVPSMSTVVAGPSNLPFGPRSPILDDFFQVPGRGPGTPDFTLSSASNDAGASRERSRNMASLGQGLQAISNAEKHSFGLAKAVSSSGIPSRSRSSSGESDHQSLYLVTAPRESFGVD